jgi:mono/diheme cytochrome c family protein
VSELKSKISLVIVCVLVALIMAVPAVASDAATTLKAKCAGCHGADGSGNTPVGKSLGVKDMGSPAVQSMTDAQLAEVITKGEGKMPDYGGKLSQDDINGLVKYIRSMKK